MHCLLIIQKALDLFLHLPHNLLSPWFIKSLVKLAKVMDFTVLKHFLYLLHSDCAKISLPSILQTIPALLPTVTLLSFFVLTQYYHHIDACINHSYSVLITLHSHLFSLLSEPDIYWLHFLYMCFGTSYFLPAHVQQGQVMHGLAHPTLLCISVVLRPAQQTSLLNIVVQTFTE